MLPRAYQKRLFDNDVVGPTIRWSFPLRRLDPKGGREGEGGGFSRNFRRLIRFHQRTANARVKLIFIHQEIQVLYQVEERSRSKRVRDDGRCLLSRRSGGFEDPAAETVPRERLSKDGLA